MIFPKMIRRNYRYRGPMESRKENNFNSGLENAINELKATLDDHDKTLNNFIELTKGENRVNDLISISKVQRDIRKVEEDIWKTE